MLEVKYFNKDMLDRCETHLYYTLAFRKASGGTCWLDGTINFFNQGKAEDFIAAVLDYQTQFVKDNLLRLEMHIPNRDQYGRLVSGWIKDTGFLLVVRSEEQI